MKALGSIGAWRSTTALLFLLHHSAPFAPQASRAHAQTVQQQQQQQVLLPADACEDFFPRERSEGGAELLLPETSWQASECVEAWSSWSRTVPDSLHLAYSGRQLLRDSAVDMRRRGSPCLVESKLSADGVGSLTMRHLAAWIFADEMGCDWVAPEWGKPPLDDSGASMYCHATATPGEQWRGLNGSAEEVEAMVHRCSLTNWLEFFNLGLPSVTPPAANASVRVVDIDTWRTEELDVALEDLRDHGWDGVGWDRLQISLDASHASKFFASLGSWDGWKREVVRNVLRDFRDNFHQSPRPWYNETLDCRYGPSTELHFAVHVRMGDRRDLDRATSEYFQMLDDFMEAVTEGVLERGHGAPMFHVFSEALLPCPSQENGTFQEFPLWPVEMDQVPACLGAERPADCPERRAGASSCRPDRSGVFRVEGRPLLLLHVGEDVAEALSCMIRADGLLMGCSTFGQLAGLLNKDSISFFSTECDGLGTAVQYKTVPPLAVAERGHMWVPVAGSWRNPVLRSKGAFAAALDELLRVKGMST